MIRQLFHYLVYNVKIVLFCTFVSYETFLGIMELLTIAIALAIVISGCKDKTWQAELSLSTQKINLPQSGGWVDLIVYTNVPWKLENPLGYDIRPESGTGSTSLRLTVEENTNLGTALKGVSP